MRQPSYPLPILFALSLTMYFNSYHSLEIIVSNNGSGNFTSITEAVTYIPNDSNQRTIVRIKAGVYHENVIVGEKKRKVSFIGDGINKTIITSDRSSAKKFSTVDTATVAIIGQEFVAIGITFVNSARVDEGQAIALRSISHYSAFFRCSFEGHQDTLNAHEGYQFYRECDIYGTIDFIFGHTSVILQNCNIYARVPQLGQSNTITADGTDVVDPSQGPSGIVIHNCTITGVVDLKAIYKTLQVKSFLGRPWRNYSTTVIMQSYIDDIIAPEGWLAWSDSPTLDTIFYREYGNRGPGSNTINRVKWPGYKALTNSNDLLNFTVDKFISGTSWIPDLGIPYIPGFV